MLHLSKDFNLKEWISSVILLVPSRLPLLARAQKGSQLESDEISFYTTKQIPRTGVVKGQVEIGGTSIVVNEELANRLTEGYILMHADELIKVKSVDKSTKTLTVERGYANTPAALIKKDAVIKILSKAEAEGKITEDFHKIAGITSPTDDSYLKTNIFTMAKQRIGWLAVLMISDTISGNIIQGYESVLARSIILTAFIPMLMSTGGNVGSQSSTVVIRALALGEISPKNAFKVLKKEFSIGIIVSIVLALLNFVRLIMIEKINIPVAFTVSITLVFTIIISKIVGALLPLLAKIVKADPAVMATPLITTISDAVTLVIYFSFATTILKL